MPPYIETFVRPMLDPVAQVAVVGVCLLILLDLLVGVVGAIVTHTFSSEKMRSGLLHKFTELALIALVIVLDGILMGGLDLGFEPLLLATCAYIAIMEVGSFLELVRLYNPDLTGVSGALFGGMAQYVQPKGAAVEGPSPRHMEVTSDGTA